MIKGARNKLRNVCGFGRSALLWVLVIFIALGCYSRNTNPDKPCPDGSMEQRHQWGLKKLGPNYLRTIDWLKTAASVNEAIGTVRQVAPVGKPNYISGYFTDGAMGVFSLDVFGDRGQGVFFAKDIRSDPVYGIIFASAGWRAAGRDTPLHPSGLTEEQARSPENRIVDATRRLNSVPPSVPNCPVLVQRAEAYAEMKNYRAAIQDMRNVVLRHRQEVEKTVNHDRGKTHTGWNKESAEKGREYYRQLVLYDYFAGQYQDAAKDLRESLKIPFVEEALTKDHLWLWVVSTMAGEKASADQELAQALQAAQSNKDLCWAGFAEFLLGSQSEQAFLERMIKDSERMAPAECGRVFGKRTLAQAYFYAAQKREINGDLQSAIDLFQKEIAEDTRDSKTIETQLAKWETEKAKSYLISSAARLSGRQKK